MATANDTARYILSQHGGMSAMKLQKLVYYSQAWSLVWDDCPLFTETIEAWANGPVVPSLYREHRGMFKVEADTFSGESKKLTPSEQGTVNAVLKHYGDKSPQWLSDLTHAEQPWIAARKRENLSTGDRGSAEILLADMVEYYGALSGA